MELQVGVAHALAAFIKPNLALEGFGVLGFQGLKPPVGASKHPDKPKP
jgi:hypothetical protein